MYTFKPVLKQTIWGGESIAPFKGIQTDLHTIGESWEISALPGSESMVADGADAGKTITQLVEEQQEKLVGKKVWKQFGTTFPLLIKFIDARRDLSIQVHPNDEVAMKRHQSRGKSEMWYVVKADEGSKLRIGFKQSITKAEYEERVKNQTILDVLSESEAKAGDVYFLPAGRVHSLGEGTFVAEIQETSDITYRIYDFGRVDAQGNPRQLHVNEARDVIDYTVQEDYRTHYDTTPDKRVNLTSCDYFTTNLLHLTKPFLTNYENLDSFVVLMCLEGRAMIRTEEDGKTYYLQIRQGMTVLLPATTKLLNVVPEETCKLLEAYS
ncbi:MAG: class I mannose-6-phosphate isomerase, partial [Bacteroidaceae bacterium]|nr:class I mannose-6-phosphate isomerase [Bacteroidaceae bacterium]